MDAAISDHCAKALSSISANTVKELCKWDREGMAPACFFPDTISSVPAWFAAAGHKFHYTAHIAEGKKASARKCNDYAQYIPIQQVMANETNWGFIYRFPVQYVDHIPNFSAPHQGSLIPHCRCSSTEKATLFFFHNNLKYLHAAQPLYYTSIYLLVYS